MTRVISNFSKIINSWNIEFKINIVKRTDNIMAKGQTTIYKALHIKLNIE
jgi:hypothetical protein